MDREELANRYEVGSRHIEDLKAVDYLKPVEAVKDYPEEISKLKDANLVVYHTVSVKDELMVEARRTIPGDILLESDGEEEYIDSVLKKQREVEENLGN